MRDVIDLFTPSTAKARPRRFMLPKLNLLKGWESDGRGRFPQDTTLHQTWTGQGRGFSSCFSGSPSWAYALTSDESMHTFWAPCSCFAQAVRLFGSLGRIICSLLAMGKDLGGFDPYQAVCSWLPDHQSGEEVAILSGRTQRMESGRQSRSDLGLSPVTGGKATTAKLRQLFS